jgi:hypothetical protein
MIDMENEGDGVGMEAHGYAELSKSILEIEKEIPQNEYEVEIDISQLIDKELEKPEQRSYKDVLSLLAKEGVTQSSKRQEYRNKQSEIHINPGEIDTKNLILPGLSLTEQIAELERISSAIAQKVLDQRHISIVAQEAYGLKSVAALQEKDVADQALISFRDKLLDDIIRTIGLVDV